MVLRSTTVDTPFARSYSGSFHQTSSGGPLRSRRRITTCGNILQLTGGFWLTVSMNLSVASTPGRALRTFWAGSRAR